MVMLLIVRCLERLFLTRNPNLAEIFVDIVPPSLPLINHSELLAEFLDLFLHAVLLACSSDSDELVLVRFLAQTERESVRMISFQGRAGRNGDQSYSRRQHGVPKR